MRGVPEAHLDNINIEGCNKGVDAEHGGTLELNRLNITNTNDAISVSYIRKLKAQNIVIRNIPDDLELPSDLCRDIQKCIAETKDITEVSKKFGDRLRGKGLDLDALLNRSANSSQVLSVLLQIVQIFIR